MGYIFNVHIFMQTQNHVEVTCHHCGGDGDGCDVDSDDGGDDAFITAAEPEIPNPRFPSPGFLDARSARTKNNYACLAISCFRKEGSFEDSAELSQCGAKGTVPIPPYLVNLPMGH